MAWSVPFAYGLAASLPYSSIELPNEDGVPFSRLFRQGWAMFTRDPREPTLHVYKESDGAWVETTHRSVASVRTAAGFDRTLRSQGIEIARALASVPEGSWVECGGPLSDCLNLQVPVAILLKDPHPTLCGKTAVTRYPPVKWSFWRYGEDRPQNVSAVVLDVRCVRDQE